MQKNGERILNDSDPPPHPWTQKTKAVARCTRREQRVEAAPPRAPSSLPAAGALVLGVPVLLLALDGAVGSVPAAVVHGLFFTVVALQGGEQKEGGMTAWHRGLPPEPLTGAQALLTGQALSLGCWRLEETLNLRQPLVNFQNPRSAHGAMAALWGHSCVHAHKQPTCICEAA